MESEISGLTSQNNQLQQEVAEGKVRVKKIAGGSNPADLMTKILGRAEIEERLGRMGLRVEWK